MGSHVTIKQCLSVQQTDVTKIFLLEHEEGTESCHLTQTWIRKINKKNLTDAMLFSTAFISKHSMLIILLRHWYKQQNWSFITRPLLQQVHSRASAHGRFPPPAAVKQTRRPIISWLYGRTVKETLRSHTFHTIWCSQCVYYTSTRHLLCHNMFYDHTLAEIWMLPDIYTITD